MGSADGAPPALPSTSRDTMGEAMDLGCTSEDIYEVADDQPPYPLPTVQVMPTQESGSVKRI
jgi:hypothetical protein